MIAARLFSQFVCLLVSNPACWWAFLPAALLVEWLASWPGGWPARCVAVLLAGLSVGCLAALLAGLLVGFVAGCPVGQMRRQKFCLPDFLPVDYFSIDDNCTRKF